MKELSKQALADLNFLGNFTPCSDGETFKGYMLDDEEGGARKIYLDESDFRNLSNSCTEAANYLSKNQAIENPEQLREGYDALKYEASEIANVLGMEADWYGMADKVKELRKERNELQRKNNVMSAALSKIARFNAMDYEYQNWAIEALGKEKGE